MRVLSRGSAVVRSLLLVLGIVGVVALTACGQGGSATPGSASRGGSVTLVPSPKGPWTINFNPLISGNNSLPGTQGMIYETLLYFNRLDGSIKPWLASSYKWSPDATSLTFTLNPGVKWSDGQPFPSADVLFPLTLSKQYPSPALNPKCQPIPALPSPPPPPAPLT